MEMQKPIILVITCYKYKKFKKLEIIVIIQGNVEVPRIACLMYKI